MRTLSQERKAMRNAERQNRKMLKRRMNEYDVLSRGGGASIAQSSGDSPDTTHDIAQYLHEVCQVKAVRPNIRMVRRAAHVDRITSQVVCPEIREAWNARISGRNDAMAACLREAQLDALARWMVYMWTEGEGYDPAKHPRT